MIVFERREGVQCKNAKLNDFYVIVIRAEYASGKRGAKEAWRFGISDNTYNRVGRMESWRHVGSAK